MEPEDRSLTNRLSDYVPAIAESAFGAAAVAVGVFFPPAAFLSLGSPIAGHVAARIQASFTDGEDVLVQEGVDMDVITTAIGRNEAVLDLWRETVGGVLSARDRAQRRALARAFAQAAKDDAKVEPGLRITRVLAQMDVPEVQALRLACTPRPTRPRASEEHKETRAEDEVWPDELAAEWGQPSMTIEEVMARLAALGLVDDLSGVTLDGLRHWRATEFGTATSEALEREARQIGS